MKRIENCELNELVRPVMDGWYSDGGAKQMWQDQEYSVHKFVKDEARLHGPYSFVSLRDGVGLSYCLNYGRFVIERLESPPSLSKIAAMPQEFWVGGNGKYYENGLNRERFMHLVRQSEAAGVKVVTAKPPRVKSSDRTYVIDMANIISATHLTRQAAACLSIIIEAGKTDGMTENDLAELLRKNGFRLNTKQDPWKIFNFYKSAYVECGVLKIHEGGE